MHVRQRDSERVCEGVVLGLLAFTLSHLLGTFNLVPAVTGATALTRLSGSGHFKLILIFVHRAGYWFCELDFKFTGTNKEGEQAQVDLSAVSISAACSNSGHVSAAAALSEYVQSAFSGMSRA
jgi:hypothetical protein